MIGPIAAGRRRSAVPSWQTVRSSPVGALFNSSGWNGWTMRQVVDASSLTDLTASKIRISVMAATSSQLKIAKMYVGLKANTYDFASTPTPVLFGGSASIVIPTGIVQVSDDVTFAYDGTSDLVIAAYSDASAAYRGNSTAGRGEVYQKNADDAATLTPTGFSVGGIHDAIWLIEAFV